MLRIIFMGTPEFAVPSLKALLNTPEIQVLAVMTQPDRPAGRGHKLTPPPVKQLALEHGLPVYQPTRLRKEPEAIAWLKAFQPDYLVTAAFGQILPQEVLDIPKYGTVNVHASLLPRYRGANPVQAAILNGDSTTGVTTMLTTLGVDEGPMLLKAEIPIGPDEEASSLISRLSESGAQILPETLLAFASGKLGPRHQDNALATHAPKLSKEDAWLDWTQSALTIHNKIRGQQPWPGASSTIAGQTLKLFNSRTKTTWPEGNQFVKRGKPGEILDIVKEGLVVQAGDEPLLIETLQPPGKPRMSARDWANGFLKQQPNPCFETLQTSVSESAK